jgi:HEAT repeat protein
MSADPIHMRHAMNMLLLGEDDKARQNLMATFATTWGGYSEDALIHAIDQGSGIDLVLAALALGDLGTPNARERLIPLLTSQQPVARWASALELGKMREERSLPTLFTMLTEFLPPDPEYITTWLYWHWRPLVPQLLGAWGQKSAVVPLREALLVARQLELATIAGSYEPNRASAPEDWARYQGEIIYALGRLGTLGALTGIQNVDPARTWWRVHLIMGSLHGRHLITSMLLWNDHPSLHEQVEGVLKYTFGLNQHERDEALEHYQAEKAFEIWSRYEQEQEERGPKRT